MRDQNKRVFRAKTASRELLTVYQAVTGKYPWDTAVPPPGRPAPDPRDHNGLSDLTPEFVAILLKTIAPKRAERFGSAAEFRDALTALKQAKRLSPPPRTLQQLGPNPASAMAERSRRTLIPS